MLNVRTILAAVVSAVALTVMGGCAVVRDQQTAGAYVDDAAITAAVKAKFIESKQVDAGAINVETLNGTVQLAGFAKSSGEKAMAESLAGGVKNVKGVRNSIVVRP
ncbi:BON domain-containing protein [Aquincola tertiaricarbonis]|uniref:BON domain-containing protein n=1 Tax=Aquincola tertiaricarbonis TaxID=391953 RepID=UPI000614D59C